MSIFSDGEVEKDKLNRSKLSYQIKSELIQERSPSKVFNRTGINIVLLGESGTGKSSFVIKYVSNRFETYHVVTLGTEYSNKVVKFNDTDYTLKFICTSGDPEFQEDYTKSYQDVDFFLMFYDVTNKKTFEKLKQTTTDIKKYLFYYKNKTVNAVFIGNKCDQKKREVTTEEAETFCKKYNIELMEISVKNNHNVPKLFNKILTTFDDMSKNK